MGGGVGGRGVGAQQAGDDQESRQEQEGDRGLARGREGVNAHACTAPTHMRTYVGNHGYDHLSLQSSLRRSAELSEM